MRTQDRAFTTFVQHEADGLLRYSYLLTGNQYQAQGLLQEGLLKVYFSWFRVADPKARPKYAQVVILREFLDWKRSAASQRETLRAPQDRELPTGPEPYGSVDSRGELEEILRSLTPQQRAALVLRYYLDLSIEETAALLGCSPGTVKAHCSRGLARARAKFDSTRD